MDSLRTVKWVLPSSENVVEAGIVERQAAARYLDRLASIGVLEPQKSGRDKVFIHSRLLSLLKADGHDFDWYD